jgi:hypothetical protein
MARTCPRCSECRKSFTPSVTTGARQKVCSSRCRVRRDRKLARRRRGKELVDHREEERLRQQARRTKRGERPEGSGCHAPPSGSKSLELREKVVVFVDRALARSRASLLRDLAEIMLRESETLADTG